MNYYRLQQPALTNEAVSGVVSLFGANGYTGDANLKGNLFANNIHSNFHIQNNFYFSGSILSESISGLNKTITNNLLSTGISHFKSQENPNFLTKFNQTGNSTCSGNININGTLTVNSNQVAGEVINLIQNFYNAFSVNSSTGDFSVTGRCFGSGIYLSNNKNHLLSISGDNNSKPIVEISGNSSTSGNALLIRGAIESENGFYQGEYRNRQFYAISEAGVTANLNVNEIDSLTFASGILVSYSLIA